MVNFINSLIKHIKLNFVNNYNFHYRSQKYILPDIINGIIHFIKYALPWNNKFVFVGKNSVLINGKILHQHFLKLRFIIFSFFDYFLVHITNILQKRKHLNLSIDSTFINNEYGIDHVSRNKFNKNKKCMKLSIICSDNKLPVSIIIDEGNLHDSQLFLKHMIHLENNNVLKQNILNSNFRFKNFKADKAYDSSNIRIKLESYKFDVLIPQNRRNIKDKSKILKFNHHWKQKYNKRLHIEHLFKLLKNFRKLKYRYEKTITSYRSVVYLAIISSVNSFLI